MILSLRLLLAATNDVDASGTTISLYSLARYPSHICTTLAQLFKTTLCCDIHSLDTR